MKINLLDPIYGLEFTDVGIKSYSLVNGIERLRNELINILPEKVIFITND